MHQNATNDFQECTKIPHISFANDIAVEITNHRLAIH